MSENAFVESGNDPSLGLLGTHVENFLRHLRAAGYAESTLHKKRPIVVSFARWTKRKQIGVENLNESHIAAFEKRSPRRRKAQTTLEMAVLRLFLGYLRLEAGVPTPLLQKTSSAASELHRRYVDYLRDQRGLAKNSISVYAPYINHFLNALEKKCGSVCAQRLDALTVQDYLLDCIRGRSSEYSRLLATALRSFFSFLHLSGETTADLSPCVPMARRWSQATVPTFLSPEEVERVLSAPDRATPSGRRDYAVLLLLARLGLRAGEVVALELGDIRWRTAEIVVRGKGRVIESLPLLSDIGKALCLYLRKDRGCSSSRRVFLRTYAPHVGLTGPAAVGHIVRWAIARAGVHRRSRGAAHLFRHSLATRMIRNGASMAEISQVLRHRSQDSTAIYAKVAFEALRGVARPWPAAGGER
jgi:integrase/recombinase XerD